MNKVASAALARPPSPPPPPCNWSHMPVYSFGDLLPPRCCHHTEGLTPPHPHPQIFCCCRRPGMLTAFSGRGPQRSEVRKGSTAVTHFFNLFIFNFNLLSISLWFPWSSDRRREVSVSGSGLGSSPRLQRRRRPCKRGLQLHCVAPHREQLTEAMRWKFFFFFSFLMRLCCFY